MKPPLKLKKLQYEFN